MTCQECQPLALDLARGVPPFDVGGAVQRAEVLSHISTCKRCAQWLREQEMLSVALRAAAEADASLAAPPAIEANVMAAFRARQARAPQHRPGPRELLNIEAARTRAMADARAWRPAWSAGRAAGFAAAAAIVIAALTMASLRWLNPALTVNGGPSGAGNASAAAPTSAPTLAAAPTTDSASGSGSARPMADGSGAHVRGSAGAPVTGTNAAVIEVLPEKGKKGRPAPPRASAHAFAPDSAIARESATRVASTTRRGATMRAVSTSGRASVARGASEFNGPAFVLLPYVQPLRPTEMRHIMRVRMTRTQLAAAELRTGGVDDDVLADVLVGEDGTARAVRIVQ